MKITTTFLFLSAYCASFSQNNVFQFQDTTLGQLNYIEIVGAADIQGTSIRNEFTSKFLFGGEITSDIIQHSKANQNSRNRIGGFVNSSIQFNCGKGKAFANEKLSWFLQAGYVSLGSLNYTTDAYQLAFEGNSTLTNDTAFFSNMRFDAFQAQKFGFGIRSKDNLSAISFNLMNIQNYAQMFVRDSYWIQDSAISAVNLDMNADLNYAAGNKKSKGIGLALDLEFRFKTDWIKGTKTWFKFSVNNLGLAFLNQPTVRYNFNDTINYSGFTIKDLIGNSNLFDSDFSLLDSLGITKREGKSIVRVPGFLQAEKMVDQFSPKKLQFFFGLRLFASIQGVPTGFAGLYYKVVENFSVSATAAYGGFGNFRGGIYFNYRFKNGSLGIGTDDVYGLISKNGFGKSINTRFLWHF